ncbi:nucleotidyl transferase AbiEii/AbiGii toxin family protein [Sinorhizobium fredii]|uniref:nucleotidyl transferase AbiEii/AbiGii toxin family protein n=1 Tax=Rhizobium fredii TaxID=380 RepID=UPI0004AE3BF1|nr:nucleotidyl transferase AbiEii/AbiGii toxin family protein [Sinorhizobium fredii]UTY48556.1 hypothetical protein EPK84_18155 [Sinorhizobium fredii]
MQDFTPITAVAVALGDRLKQNCSNRGLDVNKSASRYVAERVLAHWHVGFGPAPFMVKGGLLYPQHMRPTEDGDIAVVRHYSEQEMQRGMQRIGAILRKEGIELGKISIDEIDRGHGDPVIRIKLEAVCGTIRGNTHLDLSIAHGPFAFPQDVARQELPSVIRNQPGIVAYVQPLEASAAEKWLALLQRSETDCRVKHQADLLSFAAMGVDNDRVAREIIRVCKHRDIPLSVCTPSPAALSWASMEHREQSWNKLRAERGFAMTASQAWIEINTAWAEIHRALTRAIIAEVRSPGFGAPLLDRIAARQPLSPPSCRPAP